MKKIALIIVTFAITSAHWTFGAQVQLESVENIGKPRPSDNNLQTANISQKTPNKKGFNVKIYNNPQPIALTEQPNVQQFSKEDKQLSKQERIDFTSDKIANIKQKVDAANQRWNSNVAGIPVLSSYSELQQTDTRPDKLRAIKQKEARALSNTTTRLSIFKCIAENKGMLKKSILVEQGEHVGKYDNNKLKNLLNPNKQTSFYNELNAIITHALKTIETNITPTNANVQIWKTLKEKIIEGNQNLQTVLLYLLDNEIFEEVIKNYFTTHNNTFPFYAQEVPNDQSAACAMETDDDKDDI